MPASLDTRPIEPVPSMEYKQPIVTVKAPATEGEIPQLNDLKYSKPAVNGNYTNGVHTNGSHTNGVTNGHDNASSDPFKLASEYAYTPRKLKVFTIGAGFSGLLMAHKFQHRFPEMKNIVDHTIFEAHHEVGGTW